MGHVTESFCPLCGFLCGLLTLQAVTMVTALSVMFSPVPVTLLLIAMIFSLLLRQFAGPGTEVAFWMNSFKDEPVVDDTSSLKLLPFQISRDQSQSQKTMILITSLNKERTNICLLTGFQ